MTLNKLTDVTLISALDHLYEAGHDEDGQVVHGRIFIIFGETADGYRFELDHRFSDNTRYDTECDYVSYVSDHTAELRADALISRIQAHVDGGGKLDPLHWKARQGCYGSAGFDDAAEFALELREAHEAGESLPSNMLALAYA